MVIFWKSLRTSVWLVGRLRLRCANNSIQNFNKVAIGSKSCGSQSEHATIYNASNIKFGPKILSRWNRPFQEELFGYFYIEEPYKSIMPVTAWIKLVKCEEIRQLRGICQNHISEYIYYECLILKIKFKKTLELNVNLILSCRLIGRISDIRDGTSCKSLIS